MTQPEVKTNLTLYCHVYTSELCWVREHQDVRVKGRVVLLLSIIPFLSYGWDTGQRG